LEEKLHMKAGQFRTLRTKARFRQLYPLRSYEYRERYLSEFEHHGAPPEQYLWNLERKGTLPCAADRDARSAPDEPVGSGDPGPSTTQYSPAEPRLRVGVELAGVVVYGTVFAGWLAVIGFGVAAVS
jgi:hypothetical protein